MVVFGHAAAPMGMAEGNRNRTRRNSGAARSIWPNETGAAGAGGKGRRACESTRILSPRSTPRRATAAAAATATATTTAAAAAAAVTTAAVATATINHRPHQRLSIACGRWREALVDGDHTVEFRVLLFLAMFLILHAVMLKLR